MVQNYQKTSEVGLYLYVYPYNHCIFEWLSDQNGYTDDTICTVAVADALLHGRDFGESIHDWCNRYPHPMGGYGGRFAQWVHSENPLPYNSFGNGSAMRVSPVLLMAAVPQIPYFTHASCIWLSCFLYLAFTISYELRVNSRRMSSGAVFTSMPIQCLGDSL